MLYAYFLCIQLAITDDSTAGWSKNCLKPFFMPKKKDEELFFTHYVLNGSLINAKLADLNLEVSFMQIT